MSLVANLPVFLSLAERMSSAERLAVAATASIGVAVGVVAVILGGEGLLALFGVTIDDFRVADGLLILLIAIDMVHGGASDSHQGTSEERKDQAGRTAVGIYPLTAPILLDPGAIAALVVFSRQADTAGNQIALWAATGSITALLAATFFAAGAASRCLGQAAIGIMGRIMGMILAAIAVEMLTTGLPALLPGLAGAAS